MSDSRTRLLKLCRKMGVPLNENRKSMHWNGNRGDPKYHGTCAHEKNTIEEISHEAAHWLVAAPERRVLVNYGLGEGPEARVEGDQPSRADEARGFDGVGEELKASLLGIVMEAAVGQDPAGTLRMHCWPDSFNAKVEDIDTTWKEIPASLHFRGHKTALRRVRSALRRLINERKN